MRTQKYVLTGQPGAGKTTLLNRLSELGFYTLGEAAEFVKNSRMAQGRPSAEQDRAGFQKELLYTQMRWEREIPPATPVAFIDRGLHDGIPYYQIDGLPVPDELWNAAWTAHYAGVFFLQAGKPYRNTAVRPETAARARELGERTLDIYKRCGYSSNHNLIPPTNLDERVRMVLDRVELGLIGGQENEDYIAQMRKSHGINRRVEHIQALQRYYPRYKLDAA